MATAQDRFGDALLSIIDTAEDNGATTQEIIETLESTIEYLRAAPQNEDDEKTNENEED